MFMVACIMKAARLAEIYDIQHLTAILVHVVMLRRRRHCACQVMSQCHSDGRDQEGQKAKNDKQIPQTCSCHSSSVVPFLLAEPLDSSPRGGYQLVMTDSRPHATHPTLIVRLKRAEGHLRHVIGMLEAGKPCTEIATQIQAVESAITAAKRTLIHDHIDHCLGNGGADDLTEMRQLTKLL